MATKPSLALIPSGYKASEVYSVLPTNGDGDFDFSREGVSGVPNATRINKDGLIETVDANVPRLDYSNGGCSSLLLEPQSTNLIPHSNNFSYFSLPYPGASIEQNYSISPEGVQNSTKLNLIANSSSRIELSISGSFASQTHTVSVWARCASNTEKFRLKCTNLGYVDYFSENKTVSTEWQRFSFSATFGANAGSISAGILNATDAQERSVEIFGFQLEANKSYATSYIPTNGSTATRYADECNRTSIQEYIGQTEGTLFLDFEYLMDVGTDPNNDDLVDAIWIGSSTDSSEYIFIDNYRSGFRVYVQGSLMGVKSLGLNSAGSSLANTRYKVALKYKNNDFKCYRNGILIGSATGVVNFASPLNSFYFSWFNNSFGQNKKRVNDLRIYKTGLTDQELIQLTTI